MFAYDYKGKNLNEVDMFLQTVSVEYGRYAPANTNYIVTRVFKKRPDGKYQYPFIRDYWQAGAHAVGVSCYTLAKNEGWFLTTNAGLNEGLAIENGILLKDTTATIHAGAIPLTIDSNGDLGYVNTNTTGTGQTLVNNGIISATCGFSPIINNYENFDYSSTPLDDVTPAQRNVIGQFENGDYCIITGEGRNFANSTGFTMPQMQDFCKSLGLKFAYCLDGGGSTQTVLGLKNLNHIYENETGRTLGSMIVFNGKTTFEKPIQS